MFSKIIVRRPTQNFAKGLTTAGLGEPDMAVTLAQHDAYIAAFKNLGLDVTVLPALDEYPDSVFVEDTAVMLPGKDFAILSRPGADTREGEAQHMEAALREHGDVHVMQAPSTLDGGDVLLIDDTFYVGVTARTNRAGFEEFRDVVKKHGYKAVAVPLEGGLHLKTEVTEPVPGLLIMTERLMGRPEFDGFKAITTPAGEDYCANMLRINGTIIMPDGFPQSYEIMEKHGLPIVRLDMSEYRKMDGGLSCLSLRF